MVYNQDHKMRLILAQERKGKAEIELRAANIEYNNVIADIELYERADNHRAVVGRCEECGVVRVLVKSGGHEICRGCEDRRKVVETAAVNKKYCNKFNEACKEHNRDKYDRECFICGKTEEENTRKLDVHHVDMSKSQGCGGEKWKLVPLCMSCHHRSHNKLWQARIEYLLTETLLYHGNQV